MVGCNMTVFYPWLQAPGMQLFLNLMLLCLAKFKLLRSILRSWQSQLSNLKTTIANVKLVLSFLDVVEE